jgi:hypothetical protein
VSWGSQRLGQAADDMSGPARRESMEVEQGGGRGWSSRVSEVRPGGGGDRRRHNRLEEPPTRWCMVGRRRQRRPGVGDGTEAAAWLVGRLRRLGVGGGGSRWEGGGWAGRSRVISYFRGSTTFGGSMVKNRRK